MPNRRKITRLIIKDADYPAECAALLVVVRAELTSAYDQHDHVVRELHAATLEAEIATSVGIDAKSRYEAMAKLLEREYAALVTQLHREDTALAAEVEARLQPMNHIRELLDLAGIEPGETEDVRLMRVIRLLNAMEKQARFDKQYIEQLQEQLYGKPVTRDATPPPGSLRAYDADAGKRDDAGEQ